jgi:hypothetical protein
MTRAQAIETFRRDVIERLRNQDNLRPEMRESFVNYLATVVKHFRDAEGIRFESVELFNEPDGDWSGWQRTTSLQECPRP